MFSQTAVQIYKDGGDAKLERFLHKVLTAEVANREETRRNRLLREAAFPVYKTLQTYDFGPLKLPAQLTPQELEEVAFVADHRNLVLYGPVGTGKTHLATAIGVAACAAGYRTRFFTAAELAIRLSEALKDGTLEKLLVSILKAELLIIDE